MERLSTFINNWLSIHYNSFPQIVEKLNPIEPLKKTNFIPLIKRYYEETLYVCKESASQIF